MVLCICMYVFGVCVCVIHTYQHHMRRGLRIETIRGTAREPVLKPGERVQDGSEISLRAGLLSARLFRILGTLFWVKWRAIRGQTQEWHYLASFKKSYSGS